MVQASTCVILQSSYIPWRGYFDLIRRADTFVYLDQVQFTRRDWRTRNRIPTAHGPKWLTVPVRVSGSFQTKIFEVAIDSSQSWSTNHFKTIAQAYARAPYRDQVLACIEPVYTDPPEFLFQLNRTLTQRLWDLLSGGQSKRFIGDETLLAGEVSDPNDRLIGICQAVGAKRYLSGPSAADYMDLTSWTEVGIEVKFAAYPYAPYPQLFEPFEPGVSVLDALMNLGPNSMDAVFRTEEKPA